MKRYRIATLMTITLYFAIGMGALLDPEPLQAKVWASTIYTLTAFILMTAIVMAFIQTGRERLAWIGFAVFGWAYLLLLGFELTDRGNKPLLLSTWVLGEILESSRYVFSHSVELTTFATVGHAFFALIFAMTGALIAYSLAPMTPALRAYRTKNNEGDDGRGTQPNPLE
jgi:hypothetical protein